MLQWFQRSDYTGATRSQLWGKHTPAISEGEGLSAGTCACVQTLFSDFFSNICALFSWVSMVPLFNKQFGRHMLLSKEEKNSPDFVFFYCSEHAILLCLS